MFQYLFHALAKPVITLKQHILLIQRIRDFLHTLTKLILFVPGHIPSPLVDLMIYVIILTDQLMCCLNIVNRIRKPHLLQIPDAFLTLFHSLPKL